MIPSAMFRLCLILLCLIGPMAVGGCATTGANGGSGESAVGGEGVDRQLSHGYARLDQLLGQLRRVDGILWLKSPDESVAALLKDIASTAEEGQGRIRGLIDEDPRIDRNLLPDAVIEQRTREAIEATSREELLGSSGRVFELRMLLSQLEGLRYGAHLAREVAEAEGDEARAEALRGLAEELDGLRKRGFEMVLGWVEGVDR